jgi:regulation of enolase protein 1 (concanavalin A-like superfamily)
MRKPLIKVVSCVASLVTCVSVAQAGSLTNNFDTPANFLTSGVAGTMWDGVYLNAGDIVGSSGDGSTLAADANITLPGFLYVQSTLSSWAGADTDGFFLYKNVIGDFDVSVQVSAMQPMNYNFAGLLARAADFPSGAAYGGSEDYMNITRFQEFGIGEHVRYVTNNVDFDGYLTTSSSDSDTNSTRYVRMTRVGDLFTFYNKTNSTDEWNTMGTLSRPDLAGATMQVGIQQAVFTGNSPYAVFAEFQLSGPNVLADLTPPADPTGLTISTAGGSNSLTFSWTPGAGSQGTLLVVKANSAAQTQKPANGFTYAGISDFTSSSNLLGDTHTRILYVGSGSSVTVSGFGGSNNTYYATAYSYSGSGASTVYGMNPATASAAGPGRLSAVNFTLNPASIPVGGVARAALTASYSSGDSYDVSAATDTVWTSSNTDIAAPTEGTVSGVAIGSATITATYNGISGSKSVTVRAPAFADNFSVSHDFITNGLPGSAWDGIYMKPGDLPGATDGGSSVFTTIANANISSNNVLTISAGGTDWEGANDDGFFLFKQVTGDFQAVVHVNGIAHMDWTFAGLMARIANDNGGPFSGAEQYAAFWFFDRFNVITSGRSTVNGAVDVYEDQTGSTPANSVWLLLQRVNGTTFYCYQKFNATDPWTFLPTATMVLPDAAAGVPVQIGLAQSTYTGSPTEWVEFDSFMLDGDGLPATPPPPAASNLGISMGLNNTLVLSWTPGTGSTGSVVVVRANAPVNAQPQYGAIYTADQVFGAGSQIGNGNYVVYSGTGSSVTVTNLTPGAVYYAAVYSYNGQGATTTYNLQTEARGSLFLGALQSISVSLPQSRIPVGGIGKPKVTGLFSGVAAEVTAGATFESGDTAIVAVAGGVLTGITNGSTSIRAIYAGFTNSMLVTVSEPLFKDEFSANHNYLTGGVVGTGWDGVYATPDAVPGNVYQSSESAEISVADANTTQAGTLTVTTLNVGWEHAQNDGFFLFKNVSGDFQVAVEVLNTLIDENTNVIANYNNPGILARATGAGGVPFVGGTNESWVSWTRFDEFGIGTYARRTLNSGSLQSTQPAWGDGYYWLLMVRESGTNFSFYQRKTASDAWTPAPNGTTYSIAAFAEQPMQVGLEAGAFGSGVMATSQFSHFMMDSGLPVISAAISDGKIVLSWPAGDWTLQSTTGLTPANWQGVTVTPETANGISTVTLPATNATSFFRLAD